MRLSWGHGLAAAVVVAVAAGLAVLPSRVLTPERQLQTPLSLPQALTPAVVLAAPPPAAVAPPSRPAVAPHPKTAAQPTAPPPAEPVTPRPLPRRSRPSPVAQEPPLDVTLGRARHLPLPPDEARSTAPAAPVPPAPVPPSVPPSVPAPPAATPALPPVTTATATPAPSDCPPQSRNGNGHEQDHDHTPNGKACGYDK